MFCCGVFPKGRVRAQVPQERTRVSVSPCHHQYLVLSIFLIFAILVRFKCHLIVFICISLIIYYVKELFILDICIFSCMQENFLW